MPLFFATQGYTLCGVTKKGRLRGGAAALSRFGYGVRVNDWSGDLTPQVLLDEIDGTHTNPPMTVWNLPAGCVRSVLCSARFSLRGCFPTDRNVH
jgi:hypothetical protein